MAVLGISANTRHLGMAVIRKHALIDFKIQLYKERWSDKKANRMIGSLHCCIKEHSITSIALVIPYAYHLTPQTSVLIDRIKAHCRQKKIRISTYHPQALHCFCQAAKAKKKMLIKEMVRHYPELGTVYQKELKNKNKYYCKLFEAVGAATLLSREH